jgi:hypothetical protein
MKSLLSSVDFENSNGSKAAIRSRNLSIEGTECFHEVKSSHSSGYFIDPSTNRSINSTVDRKSVGPFSR